MHRVVGGGGGWSCSGVVVASHRFQFAFFQIKSIFLFSYFSDKNGTSQLSLFGHSWKKGTFGTQWQSLINSPFVIMPLFSLSCTQRHCNCIWQMIVLMGRCFVRPCTPPVCIVNDFPMAFHCIFHFYNAKIHKIENKNKNFIQ